MPKQLSARNMALWSQTDRQGILHTIRVSVPRWDQKTVTGPALRRNVEARLSTAYAMTKSPYLAPPLRDGWKQVYRSCLTQLVEAGEVLLIGSNSYRKPYVQ